MKKETDNNGFLFIYNNSVKFGNGIYHKSISK